MNALNEVNKVITNVSFHASRHSQLEEDEWLTAEKVAVSAFMISWHKLVYWFLKAKHCFIVK